MKLWDMFRLVSSQGQLWYLPIIIYTIYYRYHVIFYEILISYYFSNIYKTWRNLLPEYMFD